MQRDVLFSAAYHPLTAPIRHALLPGCKRWCAGKRCDYPGCPKGALSSGKCFAHGGGKRCDEEGCGKRSVGYTGTGNSAKCKAHGGGKRCSVADCSRSAAAGPTGTCVAHGGGEGPRHPASKAHVYQHGRMTLL